MVATVPNYDYEVNMRNRFMTWLYIGSAGDWAVVLFVLSAAVSCAKSLWELFGIGAETFLRVQSGAFLHIQIGLNIAIIVLFVVSMGLAFMIDSVRETK
jgi:hypothetical protein